MKNYYCLVSLGDHTNTANILTNVINGKFHHINLNKVFISTFESDYELQEIENLLIEFKLTFFLTKMTPTNFTAFFQNPTIQSDLFSDYIDKITKFSNDITDLTDKINKTGNNWAYFDINSDYFYFGSKDGDKREINDMFDDMIDKRKTKEIIPSLDELLEKINLVGLENLTEREKGYLRKYSEGQ